MLVGADSYRVVSGREKGQYDQVTTRRRKRRRRRRRKRMRRRKRRTLAKEGRRWDGSALPGQFLLDNRKNRSPSRLHLYSR